MYELAVCTTSGEVLRRFDLSRLVIGGRKCRIGRADDCDIKIKNDAISRHHLEIEVVEEDEWVVRDLGSSSGSFVENEKITERELVSGLEVRIGPAVLKFASVTARIAADLEKELED